MTPVALAGVLAGIVALVVAAELLLRQMLPRWGSYYRYRPHQRERLEVDGTALPQLSPVAHIRINRDGERGDEPPAPDERAWRALVVGGSAAECYFLDQDETWPAATQRRLREPDALARLGVPRVHVGSIARAILPCEQVCVLLERVLPRYQPLDAIFVMVGASDVVRWLECRMPSPIPEGAHSAADIFEEHPEGPWRWNLKESALRRTLGIVKARVVRRERIRSGAGSWLHRVRAMRSNAKVLLDRLDDTSPMLDHFEKHFARLLELAASKARRVIVVRQPWFEKEYRPEEAAQLWNFGLGQPYHEEVTTYCQPALIFELMRTVDSRASRVASEMGVEQIDMMPILEPSSRTFYDVLHLTPAGAAVVGREVAEVVLRR